jgi:hypothetical protein
MLTTLILTLLTFSPVQFLQTEVALSKGSSWSQDFILAPGDSLKVTASCLRQVGSSCGPFGALGDIFSKKGDNVGKAALSEWHGGTITSVFEQYRPELVYYSENGGAYTLTIENHSGHRTNLYSLTATRVPTQKKHAKFDASFRADTSYETTWTTEDRQRLVRTDTVRDTTWITQPDSVLVSIDTTTESVFDEVRKVPSLLGPGDPFTFVDFVLPDNTYRWAYWVGVEEAYSVMKQVFGAVLKTAGTALTLTDPVAAFAVGKLDDIMTGKSGSVDINYQLLGLKNGKLDTIVLGGRIREASRRMSSVGEKQFAFVLDNMYSKATAKDVHVKVVAVLLNKTYRYIETRIPTVKTRSVPLYEPYEERVPEVMETVTPRTPWKARD